MDRGKKPSTLFTKNSKIYMDMKDIIRERALPFLPAKSLRRCRGVCRDWKSTISSPFFAHTQSNTFNGVSGVFCQSASGVPSFVSLDPIAYGVPDPSLNFLPEPVDIRASSNGLVCCQGRTGNKAYYICNPVTKQWKKLPLPEADHGADPALVLVFEPSLLNFTAEYKLVCAFPSELDGIEFEIYSSEKGSWRISGDICFGDAKLFPTSGVYVNGTVYWLGTHGIISLDLATERSKILSCGLGTLGVMNKKLCTAYLRGSQKLDVSVLSNTYSNTMQMHSRAKTWIAVKPNINPNLPATLAPKGAYYTGECNYYSAQRSEVRDGVVFVRENLVLMRYENTLYSHDLKKETTATLGEVESRARIFGYVNSLVEL